MLDRLDKLEERNKQLTAEIESLRAELRAARTNTPLEDRVAVVENRVEEQAQSKVEASTVPGLGHRDASV
jgi:cell division protein FtsB